MKIKFIILVSLCFILLFAQTANAEDTAWKNSLIKLLGRFPSLFDEEIKMKNKENHKKG